MKLTYATLPPPVRPRQRPPPGRVRPGGFRIGRVWGIDISIDASWLIIVALLTFSLSVYFAGNHPGAPLAQHWGAALATTIFFFASIVLHELAHSVVARWKGVGVHGITLFIFGGISHLKSDPRRPWDEFVIAAVGPLTSALIGALCLTLSPLLPAQSLAAGVVGWLGYVNLALAVFNLMPGFPLDGGRVLRAILWAATGSLRKATRWAATAGAIMAYGLITLGIVLALGLGSILNGIWLAVIGWFLLSAARSSTMQIDLRQRLGVLRVTQAMRPCNQVAANESVDRLVKDRVLGTGERCFFVTEGDAFLGLVTLRRIQSLPRSEWAHATVSDIMVPAGRVRSVGTQDSLLLALEVMDENAISQLPVLEDGILRGVLTREDMLHLVAVHIQLGEDHERGTRLSGH